MTDTSHWLCPQRKGKHPRTPAMNQHPQRNTPWQGPDTKFVLNYLLPHPASSCLPIAEELFEVGGQMYSIEESYRGPYFLEASGQCQPCGIRHEAPELPEVAKGEDWMARLSKEQRPRFIEDAFDIGDMDWVHLRRNPRFLDSLTDEEIMAREEEWAEKQRDQVDTKRQIIKAENDAKADARWQAELDKREEMDARIARKKEGDWKQEDAEAKERGIKKFHVGRLVSWTETETAEFEQIIKEREKSLTKHSLLRSLLEAIDDET